QARWRKRRAAKLRALESLVAAHHLDVPPVVLRKTDSAPPAAYLRKSTANRVEAIDEELTNLRRRGDQLVAEYLKIFKTLTTDAERKTVRSRFSIWLKLLDDGERKARTS